MEETNLNQQDQAAASNTNIIFGTSSDDIIQDLHNQQHVEDTTGPGIDDKDLIVNEQEQNEIVNPSEETFNESPAPEAASTENTTADENKNLDVEGEEKIIDIDPDKDVTQDTGKISKAED